MNSRRLQVFSRSLLSAPAVLWPSRAPDWSPLTRGVPLLLAAWIGLAYRKGVFDGCAADVSMGKGATIAQPFPAPSGPRRIELSRCRSLVEVRHEFLRSPILRATPFLKFILDSEGMADLTGGGLGCAG